MVLGTDTSVGKTAITALLTRTYKRLGVDAAPFKPVATGSRTRDGHTTWVDVNFLSLASGMDEEKIALCRFHKPLSPHLAAGAEGERISISPIVERFYELSSKYDAVLVEGVGGLMVPLNESELFIDLVEEIGLPALIVARPHLGTINHTLLTVDALRRRGLPIAGIVINRYPQSPDETERKNPGELSKLTGLPVIGVVPEIAGFSVEEPCLGVLDQHLDLLELDRLVLEGSDHGRAIEADAKYVWHPFTPMSEYLSEEPHPLMIVKGKGCHLIDSNGRRYLDGVSSLWVTLHGHRCKEIDEALQSQLNKIAHSTLLGLANEPSALLAEELVKIAPKGLSKVFYSDNGSTAMEVGLKVAYQYWQQSGHPKRKEFITFVNAYHGDTLGAVSVGGLELFHAKFGPLLFNSHLVPAAYCYRCPVGDRHPECKLRCIDEFETLLSERHEEIAGVVLEPKVQGAAGILVQPPGYLRRIAELCRRYGVLLIVDEVATGFGRTGPLFACEHEDIAPDIMTIAKGLTGGYLPLAATLFKDEIYEAFLGAFEEHRTFYHGHTYTGNPLAASAALANIDLLVNGDLLQQARNRARLFGGLLEPLRDLRHVGEVRNCGLMAGVELVEDIESGKCFPESARTGRRVILRARERGVIVRPLGDVVVMTPTLSIGEAELEQLVDVVRWAIEAITEGRDG